MKLSVLLFLSLLTACSTAMHLLTEEGASITHPAKYTGDVKVYVNHDIGKYRTLGLVVASADGISGEKALEKLKEEAAGMGANAVVDMHLDITQGFWAPAVRASGMAVLQ